MSKAQASGEGKKQNKTPAGPTSGGVSWPAGLLLALAAMAVVCAGLWFFVPVRDAWLGVPYVLEEPAEVTGRSSFSFSAEVPCNRFYTREIGFRLEPPVVLDHPRDAFLAADGRARLKLTQGEIMLEKDIDLADTGMSYDEGGIRSRVVARYAPPGTPFCGTQEIELKVSELNFNLRRHAPVVYVSRDRRR